MDATEMRKRLEAAHKLFQETTTTREKFESIRTLVKGVNVQVDKSLADCSRALSDYERVHKGEVIPVVAEYLPERSEAEKRRKKALLLFIRRWKELKGEVERIRAELGLSEYQDTQAQLQTVTDRVTGAAKIIRFAKGPFGLVTLVAFGIVGLFLIKNQPPSTELNPLTTTPNSPQPSYDIKIQVIVVNGKSIPLTEVVVVTGPECDQEPHYHAKNRISAKATDGTLVPDPGGCGLGKVKYTPVVEQ